MPTELKDLVADPQFYQLTVPQQLDILRTNYPDFASLPKKDQGTFVAEQRTKFLGQDKPGYGDEKAPDAGFFSTLGHDAVETVKTGGRMLSQGLAEQPPTEAARVGVGLLNAQKRELNAANDPNNSAIERGEHSAALALPVIGPFAMDIADEINNGQYGQGAAHLLELVGPEVARKVPAKAFLEAAKLPTEKAIAVVKGAVRGGAQAAAEARPTTLREAVGAAASPKLALVKAAPAVLKGAVKGAKANLADIRYREAAAKSKLRPPPAWQAAPDAEEPEEAEPEAPKPTALPSGRKPGSLAEAEGKVYPPDTPPRRGEPRWKTAAAEKATAPAEAPPPAEPPKATLSGRKPGSLAAAEKKLPPPPASTVPPAQPVGAQEPFTPQPVPPPAEAAPAPPETPPAPTEAPTPDTSLTPTPESVGIKVEGYGKTEKARFKKAYNVAHYYVNALGETDPAALDRASPAERHKIVEDAHAHGTKLGHDVPKVSARHPHGYSTGLEGETLDWTKKMVKHLAKDAPAKPATAEAPLEDQLQKSLDSQKAQKQLTAAFSEKGRATSVSDLRKSTNLSKEQFDAEMLRLARAGKVSLHETIGWRQVPEAERATNLISDGEGRYYGIAVLK